MLVRMPPFEGGCRWFDSSPRNLGAAPHASTAKPPAFNRQTQGSIPWRGTGRVRSVPGEANTVEAPCRKRGGAGWTPAAGTVRGSVREVSGSLPGSQPGCAGSSPAERSARARYQGRTHVRPMVGRQFWELEVAGANPVVTSTASGTRAGNFGEWARWSGRRRRKPETAGSTPVSPTDAPSDGAALGLRSPVGWFDSSMVYCSIRVGS